MAQKFKITMRKEITEIHEVEFEVESTSVTAAEALATQMDEVGSVDWELGDYYEINNGVTVTAEKVEGDSDGNEEDAEAAPV